MGSSPLAARCWPLAARAPARPNAARQLATRSSSLSTLRRSTNTFHLPQCSSAATRFIRVAQRFILAEEPVPPLACKAQSKTSPLCVRHELNQSPRFAVSRFRHGDKSERQRVSTTYYGWW